MVQNLFDLTDRVAVVAGGAGYLGDAVCRRLAQHGARVVIADINMERAQQLADELNGLNGSKQNMALPLDISREESIRDLVDRIRSDCRCLDILISATTVAHPKSLEEISGEEFSRALSADLAGNFLLAREAKYAMTVGGSIVIFSSMYGRVAPDPRVYYAPMRPNPIEYGVAKAGIEQMIRYMAVAWARDGIRVNGIAPGPFPNKRVISENPDFVARLAQKVPLGRIGNPDEIAGAVVFLASTASSYVTGQSLSVDGGWTIW